MQRKEYKLLVENWRKVIKEETGDDFDPNEPSISDSSLDFDLDMSHDDLSSLSTDDTDSSEDMEATIDEDEKEAEIARFCDLMDISHLKDFLIAQVFRGDEEGNQFDEEGNEIDFDDMEEM